MSARTTTSPALGTKVVNSVKIVKNNKDRYQLPSRKERFVKTINVKQRDYGKSLRKSFGHKLLISIPIYTLVLLGAN